MARTSHNKGYLKPGFEPTLHPTSFDIVWAAGIFEGEGCASKSSPRKGASAVATVSQKDAWLIYKLRDLFGGKIHIYWTSPNNLKIKSSQIHHWRVSGSRARGFLMTIYKFMSPRRKNQIRRALELPEMEIS